MTFNYNELTRKQFGSLEPVRSWSYNVTVLLLKYSRLLQGLRAECPLVDLFSLMCNIINGTCNPAAKHHFTSSWEFLLLASSLLWVQSTEQFHTNTEHPASPKNTITEMAFCDAWRSPSLSSALLLSTINTAPQRIKPPPSPVNLNGKGAMWSYAEK